MNRGVYILANDRVFDQAIALLTSLRLYDPSIPVIMIPFDENHHRIEAVAKDYFQVQLFQETNFLEKLTQDIATIFPESFLRLPDKLRKLSVWFGPLDEFAYIDTDILLFQSITKSLNYLAEADFFCCDFQQQTHGINEVFTPIVKTQDLFAESELKDVFNGGFWGSRKGIFTYEAMLNYLQECAIHREYFDFSTGTTDQPILNYLVLKTIQRRLNIAQVHPDEPGSWAGSSHFEQNDQLLYDGDRRLRYLHWAGCPIRPGSPYWELWCSYRFQTVSEPLRNLPPSAKPKMWQQLVTQLRRMTGQS